MKSEICRATGCPYFYKFCGKAACGWSFPKVYTRHLEACPKN